jgi:uncharacterized protein YijF (DUF1287 family)
VIRAYRDLGLDLQLLVHEDMSQDFASYPSRTIWGLERPDSNIDHRRVPNLMVFFGRNGVSLPITSNPDDFQPGDIVTWHLGGGMTHIGIVSAEPSPQGGYLVAHHLSGLPTVDDSLFRWEIVGHYRYSGPPDFE